MEVNRKPFQGLWNIIRFNWHFYIIAIIVIIGLLLGASFLNQNARVIIYILVGLVSVPPIVSLLASYYVYDVSDLYQLNWIDVQHNEGLIVNIHAGFDETSALLKAKFPHASLLVLDFYNPVKHTEISIKRARKAYPPFPGTLNTNTSSLPIADHTADKIFVIFSAHEIRNNVERIQFFKELNRVITPNGKVFIAEHLRDLPNFLVYNVGFFHFYGKKNWLRIFHEAGFSVQQEEKMTPFISSFKLCKNANTY